MIDVFTAPDRIRTPTITTNTWKASRKQLRPGQMHREAAEQIFDVLRRIASGIIIPASSVITPVRNHGVNANDVAGDLQVFQFRRCDLAINLRERFKTAHGEQGMAERDDDRDHGIVGQKVPLNQPEAFVAELQIAQARERRNLRGPARARVSRHHIRNITTMTVVICMMRRAPWCWIRECLDVVPPEIRRHEQSRKTRRTRFGGHVDAGVQQFADLIHQPAEILAGADAADRSGQDVIEDQRGNGESGQERPHGIADHDIHAAAHEHAAAFHVNGAHGEAEQHDAEDEPGRAALRSPARRCRRRSRRTRRGR